MNLGKKIEDYTNTKITWELYDSSAYFEKLILMYASGELPTIVVGYGDDAFIDAGKYSGGSLLLSEAFFLPN